MRRPMRNLRRSNNSGHFSSPHHHGQDAAAEFSSLLRGGSEQLINEARRVLRQMDFDTLADAAMALIRLLERRAMDEEILQAMLVLKGLLVLHGYKPGGIHVQARGSHVR